MRELAIVVLLATAAAGCLFMLVAANVVLGFARRLTVQDGFWPPLTVLKPLHGAEEGLFENLASLCRQDYPSAVQVVLGVTDQNDPALAVVERLRAAFPQSHLDVVIEPAAAAANPKVANLLSMAKRIAHNTLIIADSDIRVGPDYLKRVVAALQSQPSGAVTCPYYGIANAGVWRQFARLAIDGQFLPGVLVAAKFRLARPCLGSTIALRRTSLDGIGGFAAVADCLADDHALGEALALRGEAVNLAPEAVGHLCVEASLGELWHHEVRWARTIRTVDLPGYSGWVVAHPLALALIGLGLGGGVVALAVATAAIGCRAALLAAVRRAFDLPTHPYWLIPVRDLLSFAVFVAGFFARGVSWQGQRYRLMPEGSLRRSPSS